MRCMHEAAVHARNCFVTLTYDEAHCPITGSLFYPDYQRFVRRLRKYAHPDRVRFYMCGEYGPQLQRPHFHACLFGVDFDDKQFLFTGEAGEKVYRSGDLERLWPLGISTVGAVTFESAAYVARYCVQKVTGLNAKAHYGNLVPEFNRCSLKPGIGAEFFDRFESDFFPHDYCVVNDKECPVPRYYAKRYQRRSAFAQQLYQDLIQYERELAGRARFEDNTPARLEAKEEVASARASLLVRTL